MRWTDKVIEIFEMTDGIMKSGMSEKEKCNGLFNFKRQTKEEREKIVAEIIRKILMQPVMAACPDSWKCTRITSTGKKNCVRSIWSSMPAM